MNVALRSENWRMVANMSAKRRDDLSALIWGLVQKVDKNFPNTVTCSNRCSLCTQRRRSGDPHIIKFKFVPDQAGVRAGHGPGPAEFKPESRQ